MVGSCHAPRCSPHEDDAGSTRCLLDGMHVRKEDMYTITSDTNLGGSETGLLMQTESAEATQKLIGTDMGMAHKVSVGGHPYEIRRYTFLWKTLSTTTSSWQKEQHST